jgi:NADH:ubiquinone oxidoreductase subunit 2 (subunit N)
MLIEYNKSKEPHQTLQISEVIILINIGGAPPFLFFWGKILGIKRMLLVYSLIFIVIFIIRACIFLFFYLRVVISFFIIQNTTKQLVLSKYSNQFLFLLMFIFFTFFSLFIVF